MHLILEILQYIICFFLPHSALNGKVSGPGSETTAHIPTHPQFEELDEEGEHLLAEEPTAQMQQKTMEFTSFILVSGAGTFSLSGIKRL